MNRNASMKWIVVALVVAMVGVSANAFAGWGRGGGYGPCQGGYGQGWGGEDVKLTDEQITKLQEEQKAFYEATSKLRQDLQQKRLEMASEMAKEKPDAKKAADLQKAISELDAQFDQKRLDHQLKVKQISPNAGYGPGFGGGRGAGCRMMGGGQMMGRGMMGGGGPMTGRGPGWAY